jgi:3-phytase
MSSSVARAALMVAVALPCAHLACDSAAPSDPERMAAVEREPRPQPAAVGRQVTPVRATASVPHDPDDPAIWRHPSDPARSLIIATDKVETVGGLYVFTLDGRLEQVIEPLDRPNNVDVEYGVTLGTRAVDIAVVTERKRHRLRVFAIEASGRLEDLAPEGLPILVGGAGDRGEPMGVGLYRRPVDGAVFVVVSPKSGGAGAYLAQYRLDVGEKGRLRATLVRRFGAFSQRGPASTDPGEIEAIVVDDELGYVYYSDERCCLRKYHVDPDVPDADVELAAFGLANYEFDREGVALYVEPEGRGYLVSTDQISGSSKLHLYPRAGAPGHPHRHEVVASVVTSSDATDGIDVTSTPLPGFDRGLVVMMNSGSKNFLLYRWEDIVGDQDVPP